MTVSSQATGLPTERRQQRGVILIMVSVMLALVATVAYLLNYEAGVNAALLSREGDGHQAGLIAAAGLRHAAWQLSQNSSCTGYTGIATTGFSDGDYTVAVTPASGSPVRLESTGTRATGSKRTATRRGVTMLQAPTALALTPESEGHDVYLWDGAHAGKNFGAMNILSVNNASAERTSLLRFDLSAVAANSRVVSAVLTLRLVGGNALSNGVLDIHRVTQAWFEGDEDDATPTTPGATYDDYDGTTPWVAGGGDFEPVPVDSITIATLIPGSYSWDITGLADAWTTGSVANDGVLLRASGGTADKVEFASSDHAGVGLRPTLSLIVACECGRVCGTPPPDAYLDNFGQHLLRRRRLLGQRRGAGLDAVVLA